MRIVVTTVGTMGDFLPARALAETLQGSGHEVAVCTTGMAGDWTPVFDACAAQPELIGQLTVLTERGLLRNAVGQCDDQQIAQENADLVIVHHLDYVGQTIAIGQKRRWMAWGYTPLLLVHAPSGNLWSVSSAMVGNDPRFSGCWWSTEEPPLPEVVEMFLADHGHPIVVTLGAVDGMREGAVMRKICDALASLNVPAIIQTRQNIGPLPAHQIVVGTDFSHARLFPHAALVIHHAGAGTSAQACRAGVPSVTIPHLFDQFFWAETLARRGVAPDARSPLAQRIEHVLSTPTYRAEAQRLGEEMAREAGATAAVAAIESG